MLDPAFKEITFTDDPDAASLTQDAQQATSVGLLKSVSLSGIFDLDPLNAILMRAASSRARAARVQRVARGEIRSPCPRQR